MSEPRLGRRMVLALSPEGAGEGGLRAAAELARLAGLDQLVLFLEDERALGAVGLPHCREIAAGAGGAPRALAPAGLERELGALARRLERRALDIARAAAVPARFERLRGPPEAAAARLEAEDVLAVFEPAHPGDRAFGPQAALARAPGASGAVLRLPARAGAFAGRAPEQSAFGRDAPGRGALGGGAVIAALAEGEAGPASALARTLALGAGAPLLTWRASAAGQAAEDAALRRAFVQGPRLLILGPGLSRGPRLDALLALARQARTPVLSLARPRGAPAP